MSRLECKASVVVRFARSRWRRASGLLAFSACLAMPIVVEAKTVKVSKSGPITTIQAGIDAAAAGDTVLVSAGRYPENVEIPSSKTGLTLRGKGVVTIDVPSALATGDRVVVHASGVTLRGLKAHDGVTPGFPLGFGFWILANDVTIDGCETRNCRIGVAASNAHRLVVRKSRIRSSDTGIATGGSDDVRIERSSIVGAQTAGINLQGDRASISRTTIANTLFLGVWISGADAIVDRVVILGGGYADTLYSSLRIDGDGGVVSRCVVRRGAGFGISKSGAGGVITKNRVLESWNTGIAVSGSSVIVLANDVRDGTGMFGATHGISVLGAGHVVAKNRVRRVHRDGISVGGDGCEVRANVVLDNGQDGIDVDFGESNVVTKNVVIGNAAEGIEINANGTMVLGNVAKGNRIDFAADGLLTIYDGNVTSDDTFGNPPHPEID
jgi:hypothetical protein